MNTTAPHAQAWQHISVTPFSGALGAEIDGVDLSKPISAGAFEEIHAAWLAHHVIAFRHQQLQPADQARFCTQFGELATYPFVEATEGHPNVIPVIKEADQQRNFGGAWHTDSSYMPIPPKATCLYAVQVPSSGGDTAFANTSAAFEALSVGMQALVSPLLGVFTPSLVHGKSAAFARVQDHGENMKTKPNPEVAEQRVIHPVIRTHPETGRKAIYCSIYHCERFQDMTRKESLPLITLLHEQATDINFTARLQWQPGTLAIWDNRCVFHYAINDYAGERRHMRRVTIEGETPV